ncbi:hypothetical protein KR222_000829, partial [Zaprionus bogoriensis]
IFISIAIPIDVHNRHVFLSYNFEANYRLPRTWHKEPPIFRTGNGTHEDPLADFDDYYDEYDEHGHHHRRKKKPKPSKHKKPKPKPHHKPGKPAKPHKQKHKHKHKPKPKPPPEDDYKDFFEGVPRKQQELEQVRRREENSLLSRTKFYEILSRRFEQHGFGNGDSCLLRLICEANNAQLGEHNGVLGSLMHVMFSPSSSRFEALPRRYYQAEEDGREQRCAAYLAQCARSLLDLITRPLADYIGNKIG